MREQQFRSLKDILETTKEMEILVTDIQMKLDNKSHDLESDLKELFNLTQRIQNEEKNIYHDYLSHHIQEEK